MPSPDGYLVTAADAAALHDVQPSTIRTWVNRGLLTPVAVVKGENVYRLEDVDRAEAQARRRDVTGRSKRRTA